MAPTSEAPGTLTLDRGTHSPAGVVINAYPATKAWTAAQTENWSAAPTYDAKAAVAGKPAADGKTITWELPATFATNPGTLAVVRVPAAPPAPAPPAFNKPGPSAYTPAAPETTAEPSFDSGAEPFAASP